MTKVGLFGLTEFFVVVGFNCPKDIAPTNNANWGTFFIYDWDAGNIVFIE